MIDILVLGSGPAGYTAAIYGSRAGRNVHLITGPQRGGQLTITSTVENYPGFAAPIGGLELMEQMHQQAINNGVTIVEDVVEKVNFSNKPFQCFGSKLYEARTIVIATGASAKWLGIPGEEEYRGRGVSACATCDGFFFRNRHVAVIGGGNTAVEEALYLTNFAAKVTLIHRRDTLRAENILQRRLKENSRVSVIWNTKTLEVCGDEQKVTHLKLINSENVPSELAVDGVFVAIGHQPATSIFKNELELDENGYIKAQDTKTSVPGIFAAGDACAPRYKQAVVAAAAGCVAALEADEFLAVHE